MIFDLPVTKVWEGDELEEVRFELKANGATAYHADENGEVNESDPVSELVLTKEDGWNGAFENLPRRDANDNLIDYTVAEKLDDKTYTIDYEWNDSSVVSKGNLMRVDKGITFTNTKRDIAPASVQFSGTKTLTGRELKAEEFSFTLTGAGLDETVKNDKNGAFSFDSIEYDTPGTYKYTIVENDEHLGGVTYDTKTYDVIVTVEYDNSGELAASIEGLDEDGSGADFTNTYAAANTQVQFSGTKTLTGRDLKAKEFSFTLTGEGLDETVKNDENGAFSFDPIEYDTPGTYEYTIAENDEGLGGVTYDTNEYEVTVKVEDDGNGQLVASIEGLDEDGSGADFANTYAADSTKVQFSGTKTLTGRALKADEFSFTLTGEGLSATVKNDENGGFSFDPIEYDTPGTYK